MKQVSQHRKDELARRKRMGIARVERPLRFIAAKTNVKAIKNGEVVTVESGEFIHAKHQAARGNGGMVQYIAMREAQR